MSALKKDNKLSILHVIAGMNRGGAETFVMNVFRTIDRNKFQFYFLCFSNKHFDYEDEIKQLGGEIIRIPDVKEVGIVSHIKAIKSVIKDNEINIVHAHTYYNSAFSLIAAKKAGVSTRIAHSHNTMSEVNPSLVKKIYFALSKLAIRHYATKRIACAKEAGYALFGRGNNFIVINNGIDLSRFSYKPAIRKDIRIELNIPQDATVLLNIARFQEVKNHTYLIDVFKEYIKIHPNSHLLLVGDGPLRNTIENKVRKLKLANCISFTGVRSDTEKMYNSADIFVMPSIFEGLPVVLIEAQANRLPCIVSDSIDHDVKINDNFNFLNIHLAPSEWATAIKLCKKRRGQKSHKLDKLYDIKNIVKQLASIYKEVL